MSHSLDFKRVSGTLGDVSGSVRLGRVAKDCISGSRSVSEGVKRALNRVASTLFSGPRVAPRRSSPLVGGEGGGRGCKLGHWCRRREVEGCATANGHVTKGRELSRTKCYAGGTCGYLPAF